MGWAAGGKGKKGAQTQGVVRTIIKYVTAPASKGAGKGGKAWGGGKGKGKKGNWGNKVPYAELSEEKRAEIRERHDARATEEGRVAVGNAVHKGTLLKRGRFFGWILPDNPMKFPKQFRDAMDAMTAEKKAASEERGKHDGFFDQSVIYVRMSDVNEGVKIDENVPLKFKVYTDASGVGAYEVDLA